MKHLISLCKYVPYFLLLRNRGNCFAHTLVHILLFVGFFTSRQHASVSQGRICSDSCMCCHTQIEVGDQMCYLTQSQSTDTGSTCPSADPIMPGTLRGSHWSTYAQVTGMTPPGQRSTAKVGIEPRSAAVEADALTARPTTQSTSTQRPDVARV